MVEASGYSYPELVAALPIETAIAIDGIQQNDLQKEGGPTSDWLDDYHRQDSTTTDYLTGNVEVYDDEIETILDADEVIKSLLAVRERFPDSQEFTWTVRARRTVLTRLVLEGIAAHNAGLNAPETGAA